MCRSHLTSLSSLGCIHTTTHPSLSLECTVQVVSGITYPEQVVSGITYPRTVQVVSGITYPEQYVLAVMDKTGGMPLYTEKVSMCVCACVDVCVRACVSMCACASVSFDTPFIKKRCASWQP